MRKIYLKDKTATDLYQIISNSESPVKESLTVAESIYGEYLLLQDTSIVKERLTITTDEDGNQSMIIEETTKG